MSHDLNELPAMKGDMGGVSWRSAEGDFTRLASVVSNDVRALKVRYLDGEEAEVEESSFIIGRRGPAFTGIDLEEEPGARNLSDILAPKDVRTRPTKVNHAFLIRRAAGDLRSVAALFEKAAGEVEEGDLGAFWDTLSSLPKWHEMLGLRASYLEENKGKTIEIPINEEVAAS